jgi:hypothetical protein
MSPRFSGSCEARETMKRKKTPEEIRQQLVETDANFRRLHDRIVEISGAPPLSSEEIDRRLQERIDELRRDRG